MRKRHIAVEADGRLPRVTLTSAGISDSAGAEAVLRARWPWMTTLFAACACDRAGLMDEAARRDFTVHVVRRIEGQAGFQVLPRRRGVERSFAWKTGWRPHRATPRPAWRLRSHETGRTGKPARPKARPLRPFSYQRPWALTGSLASAVTPDAADAQAAVILQGRGYQTDPGPAGADLCGPGPDRRDVGSSAAAPRCRPMAATKGAARLRRLPAPLSPAVAHRGARGPRPMGDGTPVAGP